MKAKYLCLTMLFVANFSIGQYSQYIQFVTPYLSDSIQSGFFYFDTPNNFQAGQLYQLYRQNAPDLNNNNMIITEQHIDSLAGLTHIKYQQTYMNIPIEGAGCIEHYDTNGSLLFINAKVADSITKSHIPKITREDVITLLIDAIRRDAEKIIFAWDDPDWEKQIQLDKSDPNGLTVECDLSDLSNGVYLVNVELNGAQFVKRIIVQK